MAVPDVFRVIDGKGHAAAKPTPSRAPGQCISCEVVVCCAAKPISERPSNRQKSPRTACPTAKPEAAAVSPLYRRPHQHCMPHHKARAAARALAKRAGLPLWELRGRFYGVRLGKFGQQGLPFALHSLSQRGGSERRETPCSERQGQMEAGRQEWQHNEQSAWDGGLS